MSSASPESARSSAGERKTEDLEVLGSTPSGRNFAPFALFVPDCWGCLLKPTLICLLCCTGKTGSTEFRSCSDQTKLLPVGAFKAGRQARDVDEPDAGLILLECQCMLRGSQQGSFLRLEQTRT